MTKVLRCMYLHFTGLSSQSQHPASPLLWPAWDFASWVCGVTGGVLLSFSAFSLSTCRILCCGSTIIFCYRLGVYAASAYVREDKGMRNRQKLFSQWTDLAFTEKSLSRISRFVRGPQAAARFLCMSLRLNEPKHIVAEATTDIQPGSRLSLNRDLGFGTPMWPWLRSEMLGLLTSKCCPVVGCP
jgi:hypothetical protein